MIKLNTNHLAISWSISKGRDTYGYNICRLDSSNSGKRYRCIGGGYDMLGTVVADWLVAEHQDKLLHLARQLMSNPEWHGDDSHYVTFPAFYGMTYVVNGNRVAVDGACGIESVRKIAEACGIELQRLGNRKGHTIGFIASWEA